MGLTIAQVVHDYGDVCQTITEMAVEQNAPITGEEFRTLNLCLDDAIAQAVTEYSRQHEQDIADQGTELQNAFKFTPSGGRVTLTARANATRVFFDVEDECGGLPPGKAEELFRPFE